MRIDVGDPEGELVHVQLAQQHSARISESRDHHPIFARHTVSHDLAATGGADALGIEEVFEGDGYAVERPLVLASADLGFCLFGLGKGAIGRDSDVGVDDRVYRCNAVEVRLSQLHGRQSFGGDLRCGFGHAEVVQFIARHQDSPMCFEVLPLVLRQAQDER